MIAAVAAPAAGLLVSAGLAVAGTPRCSSARPAVRRCSSSGGRRRAGAVVSRRGRAVLPVALVTGAAGKLCLSGLGLVVVAFCRARHDPAAAGWIEAALHRYAAAPHA